MTAYDRQLAHGENVRVVCALERDDSRLFLRWVLAEIKAETEAKS